MNTGEPMAMFVGPSLAQQLTSRLGRAVRACARYRADLTVQHRVNDRLADQLMGSLGYSDVELAHLGVDLANANPLPAPPQEVA
jgi:hypothetical protein